MKAQRIVIAGGGVGGLTAAVALAQSGHEVEVLEQAPALSASAGAGVTLAPNAMHVYKHLGIDQALCDMGVEPKNQRVQDWKDGHVLITMDRDSMRERYGAPYLYVHRADLHTVLVKALEDTGRGHVTLGGKVIGAAAHGDTASAELENGAQIEGDLVVGADGVKSPIRRLFDFRPAHFTGHVCWRALAPIKGELFHQLADFPGIHIGPGRMAVRYPIRHGETLNLVFFARQDGWAEEGWAIPGYLSELDALFGDWAPEVGAMIESIDEAALFKWAVFAHQPLESWVKDGRITLLGDAAHAMTPFMGQGAACAIEDAMVLGRCLDASDDMAESLGRYEKARLERCNFIQAESNANADRLQGDETHLFGMTNLRNEETLGLFEYDANTVAI